MGDLTLSKEEQDNVRRVLQILKFRCGTWSAVSQALGRHPNSGIGKVASFDGSQLPVSEMVAFRVARFVGIPIDDLLAGKYLIAGMCPYCGHVRKVDEPL